MQAFLFSIKQQANILSLLLLLLLIAFIGRRYKKRNLATVFFVGSLLLFLLSSTAYLPRYLAENLESKYPPFNTTALPAAGGPLLIHVLGSGYNLDERLPANARLGLVALGRLTEAVRIHQLLPNSIVVCSGNSVLGLQTQAEVTQAAALSMGIDSSHTAVLLTPATTIEEAKDLKKKFGVANRLIVVTDAIHMPRAMRFFKGQGFKPIAAPTNYKVPQGPASEKFKWWPSINNIELTDMVLHEYLGNLKSAF